MLLPAEEKAMVDKIIELARVNLERDGHLVAVCFVMNTKQKQQEIYAPDVSSYIGKLLSYEMIRIAADKKQANMTILVTEAWMVKADTPQEAEAVRNVSEHPNRQEVVSVMIELPGGYWGGASEIKTDKDGKKTFGELTLTPAQPDQAVGMATGFLRENRKDRVQELVKAVKGQDKQGDSRDGKLADVRQLRPSSFNLEPDPQPVA